MTRKELMRRIGLGKDWRFVRFDHEEVIAQHIPTGKKWGFRY